MDESTKQLEELIKSIKDSVQSEQLSLSIQLLKCPICDFSSNYNSSLKKHVSSIHGDPETCCGICKKYFKRSMLQEHKQLIHSYNGREFKCSLCDYSSKSNQNFKYHVSSIHGDPDHKCLICKKMFKKSMLQAHKEEMHSNMVFNCDVCAEEFQTKAKLTTHIFKQHKPSEKRLKCDQCDKAFKYKCDFLKHACQVHLYAEKKYKCENCNYNTSKNSEFKKHIKIHLDNEARSKKTCSGTD